MSTFPVALSGTNNTLMWAQEHQIEPAAVQQLRNIARLPWVHGIRVMPDVHLGKGATVGSVIGMRNAVSPSAVGVDIGCGMMAVKTNVMIDQLPDDLRGLRTGIEKVIPVGFTAHDGPAPALRGHRNATLARKMDALMGRFPALHAGVQDREGRAVAQIGTLGGGNHYIEVTAGQDGTVWLTLHSGSRNIGKEIAERHINTAKGLEHNLGLPDRDLAVFLRGTPEMDAYTSDLFWAQDYAALNRAVTMTALQSVFAAAVPGVKFVQTVQCHHNYVALERHGDVDLIVTRKGAISAHGGTMGIIPGSMATGAYIVRGRGSQDSYCSASHGAGRKMSRSAAKRTFTVDDLAAQTAGVECRKDAGVIDEIPGAYKNIDDVMRDQADLVEVVERLTTLLCVKG